MVSAKNINKAIECVLTFGRLHAGGTVVSVLSGK